MKKNINQIELKRHGFKCPRSASKIELNFQMNLWFNTDWIKLFSNAFWVSFEIEKIKKTKKDFKKIKKKPDIRDQTILWCRPFKTEANIKTKKYCRPPHPVAEVYLSPLIYFFFHFFFIVFSFFSPDFVYFFYLFNFFYFFSSLYGPESLHEPFPMAYTTSKVKNDISE